KPQFVASERTHSDAAEQGACIGVDEPREGGAELRAKSLSYAVRVEAVDMLQTWPHRPHAQSDKLIKVRFLGGF
ncbi:hypothetical protein DRY87_26525, partial [Salmonella enterica subsp. enterica serovar Newport]|nr:hypothetical protein [Salmonella enterica subsp. enterica serovar Newport]